MNLRKNIVAVILGFTTYGIFYCVVEAIKFIVQNKRHVIIDPATNTVVTLGLIFLCVLCFITVYMIFDFMIKLFSGHWDSVLDDIWEKFKLFITDKIFKKKVLVLNKIHDDYITHQDGMGYYVTYKGRFIKPAQNLEEAERIILEHMTLQLKSTPLQVRDPHLCQIREF